MAQYILTVAVIPAGGGYTSPSVGSYSVETDYIVTVIAYPYSGYEFDHWEIWEESGQRADYPLATYQFAMPGPFSLTAHFRVAGSRPRVGIPTGTEKTPVAVMTNPTSKPYDYNASLFLGITAVARSDQSFHLNAGESKSISFPLTMPEETGLYPVYLSVASGGVNILLYRGEDDVVVIGASDLLTEYYNALVEAYTLVEAGYPNDWVMIPGYGLQYAGSAIDQIKALMLVEAVNIGLIATTADAYFVRAVMYFSDGTTIIPYWWDCPYCTQRFRSPEARDAHIAVEHAAIMGAQGVVVGMYPNTRYEDPDTGEQDNIGMTVRWQNTSAYSIIGHIDLWLGYWSANVARTASSGQDATVAPGGYGNVYFPFEFGGQYSVRAVLYGIFNGVSKFLDEKVEG